MTKTLEVLNVIAEVAEAVALIALTAGLFYGVFVLTTIGA